MLPKIWISPLSKNVITAVSKINRTEIGFIISKNQVNKNNGYTGFNNESLKNELNKFDLDIHIGRDHSDSNKEDLLLDCLYLNYIHIDPFKEKADLPIEKTIEVIKYCYSINKEIYYEVGTEQAVYPYHTVYLSAFLDLLKQGLSPDQFKQIKFAVIQCGTGLENGRNIGVTNLKQLETMRDICRKYNITPKEHNADYQKNSLLKQKLDLCPELSFNIAPEIGTIESREIYNRLDVDNKENMFKLCMANENTTKWFSNTFNYEQNKQLVCETVGHYLFNKKEFIQLKKTIKDADYFIQMALIKYLKDKLALYDV